MVSRLGVTRDTGYKFRKIFDHRTNNQASPKQVKEVFKGNNKTRSRFHVGVSALMQNSTLFQMANQPRKPDLKRDAPVVWLKRFVILSSLSSKKAIRNIPFRRGLNIIQTRKLKPTSDHGGPVARQCVGKTLLMRLIRYSLGEGHFGTEDTQSKILTAFPTLVTVGHWEVAGEDWIVVRQVNDADDKLAFAVKSNDWKTAVVDRRLEELPYKTFLSAVNEAVLSDLPELKLPTGSTVNWPGLLAWLTRDYQCGYRHANDWRHPEANSGPSLQREDNSLVMLWVMGLMESDEIEYKVQHRALLDNRSAHKKTATELQQQMETLWPVLQVKLEVSKDAEMATQQGTFKSFRPANLVTERIESLERLRNKKKQSSRTTELETKVEALQTQLADFNAGIRSRTNSAQYIDQQIDSHNQQSEIDPPNQQQLAAKLAQAQTLLSDERERIANALSIVDQSIGRWKAIEDDAKIFQDLSDSYATTTRQLSRADGKIERSLHLQEDLRATKLRQINDFSDEYNQLLQQIFGAAAGGSIKVDANGIHPSQDDHLAPAGTVLSAMTTVLAFDIASLSASMKGIGHHPRFLMHDSPREGGMEAPLFSRLFEVVHQLEETFEDPQNVSFQYIVTTTTAPPKHLATKPFLAETLDARSDKGLLLKQPF